MYSKIYKFRWIEKFIQIWRMPIVIIFSVAACAPVSQISTTQPVVSQQATHPTLKKQGYSIQLAAFNDQYQADRYIAHLDTVGVEASIIQAANGLWTVRTGLFTSLSQARDQAKTLQDQRKIDDYFIVNETHDTQSQDTYRVNLSDRIIKTAKEYLGIRYKWGGTSAKIGFDCSGFTMAVFRQHGINLPRSSSRQSRVGKPVEKNQLKSGDLVFFSTGFGKKISHVGIYIGNGTFIHASTRDKCIRLANMAKPYYRKRYQGARRVISLVK